MNRRTSNYYKMAHIYSGYATGLALLSATSVFIESVYPAHQTGVSSTAGLGIVSFIFALGIIVHFEQGHRLKHDWIVTLILPTIIEILAFILSIAWLGDAAKHMLRALPPSPHLIASLFPYLLPILSLNSCLVWGIYPYLTLIYS
ncbi:hypothetical protein DSO57_1025845 [Entomophthora muscae]|uniref:Uncharacterized protein n=1 Tax=Entomophthora muscae TaxID=34485 RepID=A0ACC2RT79_9FUNG|nr:hypothetical protein DSO57_1025845 [Entomophthora muscae]